MLKRFTVCIFLLAVLSRSRLPRTKIRMPARAIPNKWQQLFNGKDLNGWKHVGPGGDTVEDGLIRTHGGMGLLYWTGGKIGNCDDSRRLQDARRERQLWRVHPHSASSRAKSGCRCTTASKCRSTTIPKNRKRMNIMRPACFTR